MVIAHLGGWCRRGVPVVLWVLEATRRRSCGRREPREGCQSRRGACEGTEGRGRGVDSTSRVRGPPGRPYLLVWDQTLITLSSTFARIAQKSGGCARRGAPIVIEWGPIARLVAPFGAWNFLLKFSALAMRSRWSSLDLVSEQIVLICIGALSYLLLGSLSVAGSRRPMCSADGLLCQRRRATRETRKLANTQASGSQ